MKHQPSVGATAPRFECSGPMAGSPEPIRSSVGRHLQFRHRRAAKSRRHGARHQPRPRADRATRAQSVAMPVLAYIWRYSLEISTNASRPCSVRRPSIAPRFAAGVEPVPGRLRAAGGSRRATSTGCGEYTFGPLRLRDQPVPRDAARRRSGRRVAGLALPLLEVDRARKRRQHHELREGDAGTLGQVAVASNVSGRSLGRPKMNEPSTWTPCLRNALQPVDERSPDEIESLVDVLQPFRRHRLDADQRAADVAPRASPPGTPDPPPPPS